MNYNAITVDDCIKMQELKHQRVILHNGQVTGFTDEPEIKKSIATGIATD